MYFVGEEAMISDFASKLTSQGTAGVRVSELIAVLGETFLKTFAVTFSII